MPKNGHLTWKAIYQPGKVVAVGYKNGKRVLVETEETRIQLTCNADHLKDGTISVISYMIREFLYLLFIIIVLIYIICKGRTQPGSLNKYRSNIIPRARDNCVLTIHKSPQKTTKLRKKADKGNL